jgi:multicomponent Na+:H+ antiporter subunit F
MTTLTFAVLSVAAALFMFRMCVGPSLADRVLALNGVLLVGMGALATYAISSGTGAFLPTLVVVALVGPISTGMVARYMEGRSR